MLTDTFNGRLCLCGHRRYPDHSPGAEWNADQAAIHFGCNPDNDCGCHRFTPAPEPATEEQAREIPVGQPWLVTTKSGYRATAVKAHKHFTDGEETQWHLFADDGRSGVYDTFPADDWMFVSQLVAA